MRFQTAMSQFKKTFDGTKLKTNLKLAINRLKLLEKKKTEQNLKARKEISEYLVACKNDRARVRVEQIIREDYLVEALEMVEMNCDLLLGRIGIMETCSNEVVPMDLEECLSNILFAAPRIYQDINEMSEISKQLQRKFKKEAFAQLQQNSTRKANPKLVNRLDIRPPAKSLVEAYLVEIAESHKVDFKPDPHALDGSVDQLSSADFQANQNGDLINFGPQDHQQQPYPHTNGAPPKSGPGYPSNPQFPNAPQMNPNYPSSAASQQQPPMPNPYNNPPNPFNAPPSDPSANGVPPNGSQKPPSFDQQPPYRPYGYMPDENKNGMPPAYTANAQNQPNGSVGNQPAAPPPAATNDANTANGNLQQWSNLAFELPQIPTDLGGNSNNSNNNDDNTSSGGGGGQGEATGTEAPAASLDMDDLEARLNRLKGL